ncbi:hypothetical protein ACROYT_G024908 [Oculina patagonica]
MKPPWKYVLFILTSLGITSASGKTNKDGIHVVEDTHGSFRPRILISRQISHREVVLEVDLTAIELGELMVNLNYEDTLEKRNSVNTTWLHGEDPNEPKESRSSMSDGNQSNANMKNDVLSDTLYVPEDIASENDNGTQQHGNGRNEERPNNSSIWLNWYPKLSDVLYDGIIYTLFGWNELPKDINQNCLNWRSVTMSTVESPCPGYCPKEHNSSISDANQSTANMNKDVSSDAVIVPEYIASENDNEILQGGDDRNRTILSKEHPKLNHSRGSSIGKRYIQRNELPTSQSPTWLNRFDKIWNVLYDVIINVFGLTELPKDINQNSYFNWRSVTMSAVDSPCLGYSCVDPAKYVPAKKVPKEKEKNSNSSPRSVGSSMRAITDDTATPETDRSKANNVSMERAVTLANKNKKSENTTRMDSENRLLDLMENVTLSSTAEKKSNKVLEAKYFHGNTSHLIVTTNWTLRDTYDVVVISWIVSFGAMVLHLALGD